MVDGLAECQSVVLGHLAIKPNRWPCEGVSLGSPALTVVVLSLLIPAYPQVNISHLS